MSEAGISAPAEKLGDKSATGEPRKSPDVDQPSRKGVFGWTTIDGTNLPCLIREEKQYVCVRMVEMKLLSKYPNNYPDELKNRAPLMSQFATKHEVKLLNEINSDHCNYEYGTRLFGHQDLLVKLTDFQEFYNIVKKHFPNGAEEPVAKKVQGGWLQLNNTVVPYVWRNNNDVKLVPVSVIKYAAGLLVNIRVEGSDATKEECDFLTETCTAAGLDFKFNAMTKLIEMSLLKTLSKVDIEVKVLPGDDPFGQAEYKEMLESQDNANGALLPNTPVATPPAPPPLIHQGYPPGLIGPGMPPGIPPGMLPGPMRPALPPELISRPWMNPHLGVYPGDAAMLRPQCPADVKPGPWLPFTGFHPRPPPPMLTPMPRPHAKRDARTPNEPKAKTTGSPVDLRAAKSSPSSNPHNAVASTVIVHDASKIRSPHGMHWPVPAEMHEMPHMQMRPPLPGASLPPHDSPGGWQQKQMEFNHFIRMMGPAVNQVMLPGARAKLSPGATATITAPNSQHGTPPMGPPMFHPNLPSPLSTHQPGPLIEPLEFFGKTISFIIKDGVKHVLLEAIARVYFPQATMDEFIFALKTVLGATLHRLSMEEEMALIRFYGLQTKALKCNLSISLQDLEQHMPQLIYMFTRKEPAPVSPSVTTETKKRPTEEPVPKDAEAPITDGERPNVITQLAIKSYLGNKRPNSDSSTGGATKTPRRLDDAINRLRQNKMMKMTATKPTEASSPHQSVDSPRSETAGCEESLSSVST